MTARFDGVCRGCGEDIGPGDDIRADGHGGWLGRCCGGDAEPVRAPRVLRDVTLVSWGPDEYGMGSYRVVKRPGSFGFRRDA